MKKFQKGFTLIELLVVVAIIGVLASVVSVSVNNARETSFNNSIKSIMKSLHAQAALFFADNNSYTNICLSATTNGIYAIVNNAAQKNGLTLSPTSPNTSSYPATSVICHSNTRGWMAAVKLKNSNNAWCVASGIDPSGTSYTSEKEVSDSTGIGGGTYACP